MMKLYEKNEVRFAILMIILYVIPCANLRGSFGDESPWMLLFLLALTVLIAVFLVKNGLLRKYGLKSFPDARKYLFFVPFLLIGFLNLMFGVRAKYAGVSQLIAVCSMILIGFVEEIIFRGFLFEAMRRDNLKSALIVSALTFGMGHIINLFAGQASFDTVLQMLYAITVGYVFVVFYYKSGSLWPCIITHSLIDATSKFSNDTSPLASTPFGIYFGPVFLIAVSLLYAAYINKIKE